MSPFALHALTSSFRWLVSSRARSFAKALQSPRDVQNATLARILRSTAGTEYGRRLDLSSVSPYRFHEAVPTARYEDLEPWIKRQKESTTAILTPGVLKCWEKTSGSRGPEKWIPYNSEHLQTFQNMFLLWSYDLLQRGLKLETGCIFFLVSPRPQGPTITSSGVRVGMRDDSEYLSGWVRSLSKLFFLDTSRLHQDHDYVKHLSLTLASERNLEMISIWSPSLLLIVLEHLREDPAVLWPKLKWISCWDQGAAREDADRVRQQFPGVEVQGKGLLSTEAAITLPWQGAYVPMLQDYFYEFECEETGHIFRLEELERERVYKVIVTCPNGFLRYVLGDRVCVDGFVAKTPSLRFLGRSHDVSDLCGEKLHADFVDQQIRTLRLKGFALILPMERRYSILTSDPEDLALAGALDTLFQEQHHYRLARDMGQLAPVSAHFVPDLRSRYFECLAKDGKSFGQIKNSTLITDQGRARLLTSELLGSVR